MQETTKREGTYMSFTGFSICVKSAIQAKLGKDYKVKVEDDLLNNDVSVKRLSILKKGSNLATTIRLNNFYNRYRKGEELSVLEQQILSAYEENRPPECFQLDPVFIYDWNWIKGKIVFKLVNKEQNKEYLETIPFIEWNDLAIVFYCYFGIHNDSRITIQLDWMHLVMWQKHLEDIWEEAKRNTPILLPHRLVGFHEEVQRLKEFFGVQEDEDQEEWKHYPPMYIISNKNMMEGAGTILYDSVLKELADKLDSDLIILPSSINEVIIMKDEGFAVNEESFFNHMIQQANEQVCKEEVLSNHYYKYVRSLDKVIY